MNSDPRSGARQRLQVLCDACPELLNIPTRAERIIRENARFAIKSARFYQLADEMKAMMDPFVVCSAGCSHCCRRPTLIYQHEADAIAERTQCKAQQLQYRPMRDVLDTAKTFLGQPCPFLVEDRCSIYASRPLICRLHNSLHDDPEDCRIGPSGELKAVMSVDPDFVEIYYHQAVFQWRPQEPCGFIQEFFGPADLTRENGT